MENRELTELNMADDIGNTASLDSGYKSTKPALPCHFPTNHL